MDSSAGGFDSIVNNTDARGQWENILNDLTDTTGDVFLGAGMQCARCHDHKFDPVPSADYYALYGVFRSTTEPVVPPLLNPPPRTNEHELYDAELKVRQAALEAQTPGGNLTFTTVMLTPTGGCRYTVTDNGDGTYTYGADEFTVGSGALQSLFMVQAQRHQRDAARAQGNRFDKGHGNFLRYLF